MRIGSQQRLLAHGQWCDLSNTVKGLTMFCSTSITIHLLRGLAAVALLLGALLFISLPWPVRLTGAVLALVLMRGCPTCWLVGLIETIARRKQSIHSKILDTNTGYPFSSTSYGSSGGLGHTHQAHQTGYQGEILQNQSYMGLHGGWWPLARFCGAKGIPHIQTHDCLSIVHRSVHGPADDRARAARSASVSWLRPCGQARRWRDTAEDPGMTRAGRCLITNAAAALTCIQRSQNSWARPGSL